MTAERIIIAGAGQAGFQLAASLRQEGFDGEILLIGDESGLPYQRPPLSKGYIKEGKAERLLFRNADFFAANRIDYLDNIRMAAIERADRTVSLADGRSIGFSHLVLALGARNRPLPIAGTDLEGVIQLRTLADAERVREAIGAGGRLMVIGGGFIGLEIAATARALGLNVTVLEATHRLMSRAVSAPVSAHFLEAHRAGGIDIRLESRARRIVGKAGRVSGVELEDGAKLDADLVLVSAGVIPNSEIAEAAGLYVHDGIRVNDRLETEDGAISAIGDCASFPFGHDGVQTRLESVQNAVDQAKCVARRLTGHPEQYRKVPWFWSDQGSDKLQMAGLTAGADHFVEQRSDDGSKLTVHCFRRGDLIGVETVNAPGDHMAARKLLGRDQPPTLGLLQSIDFDLRAL